MAILLKKKKQGDPPVGTSDTTKTKTKTVTVKEQPKRQIADVNTSEKKFSEREYNSASSNASANDRFEKTKTPAQKAEEDRKRKEFQAKYGNKSSKRNGGIMRQGGGNLVSFAPINNETEIEFNKYLIDNGWDGVDQNAARALRAKFDASKYTQEEERTIPRFDSDPQGLSPDATIAAENDMTWFPNPGALSAYKMGNKEIIFGHYGSSKYGGGTYDPATHGDAESKGFVKPIRYNDYINLKQNQQFKNKLPKDYDAVMQGINSVPTKQYGGKY